MGLSSVAATAAAGGVGAPSRDDRRESVVVDIGDFTGDGARA